MGEILGAFGVDWRLLIIQTINFSVLLIVLWYFLYRPILNILDERQKKIKKGMKDAEKASKEYEEINQRKNEILKEASKEGQEIVLIAKQRAEEKGAEVLREANENASSVLKDAQMRAEEEKAKALRESKEEIAKTAILAAERILKNKLS